MDDEELEAKEEPQARASCTHSLYLGSYYSIASDVVAPPLVPHLPPT